MHRERVSLEVPTLLLKQVDRYIIYYLQVDRYISYLLYIYIYKERDIQHIHIICQYQYIHTERVFSVLVSLSVFRVEYI